MRGKIAPCSGLHVPPDEAIEALKAKDIEVPALRLELKEQKEFYEKQLLQAEGRTTTALDAFNGLQGVVSEAITKNVSADSVWESPVFWGVTMLLLGAIAGGATVLALE